MKKLIIAMLAGVLLSVAMPALTGAVVLASLLKDGPAAGPPDPAAGRIPTRMLNAYHRAVSACPGLSWTVLAAIGTIESDNGQAPLPGVTSGHNAKGAAGPMQFEAATFAHYARPVPAGGADPPNPYDPLDASFAAARLLCANGAARAWQLPQAIFAYNHSRAYVTAVLQLATSLAVPAPGPAARTAVRFALAQIGTPYRWGGESPGVGFDCSGLVQAAWAAAGVTLPRVAADQFELGPRLPDGSILEPGDLVFFGSAGGAATHVGLVVDASGLMVDAPHAGAAVRVESFPLTVGSQWGDETYLGAVRINL